MFLCWLIFLFNICLYTHCRTGLVICQKWLALGTEQPTFYQYKYSQGLKEMEERQTFSFYVFPNGPKKLLILLFNTLHHKFKKFLHWLQLNGFIWDPAQKDSYWQNPYQSFFSLHLVVASVLKRLHPLKSVIFSQKAALSVTKRSTLVFFELQMLCC